MKHVLTFVALTFISVLTAALLLQNQVDSAEVVPIRPDTGPGSGLFRDHCAACHQPDGRGTEGGPPPLRGSSWLEESETLLIKIVLHGLRGTIEVAGKTYDLEMPSFGGIFTDDNVADVLSFVRRNWGGDRAPITPEAVSRVRAATQDHIGYWTVEELLSDP